MMAAHAARWGIRGTESLVHTLCICVYYIYGLFTLNALSTFSLLPDSYCALRWNLVRIPYDALVPYVYSVYLN